MSRKKHGWLYLDLYRVNLHVATNPDQLRDLLRTFDQMEDPTVRDDPPAASTAGWLGDTDGVKSYHVVWWIDAPSHSAEDLDRLVNTVAHEAMHGAGMIWRNIGAQLDATAITDEPLAYLVGFLTEWLWSAAIEDVPALGGK